METIIYEGKPPALELVIGGGTEDDSGVVFDKNLDDEISKIFGGGDINIDNTQNINGDISKLFGVTRSNDKFDGRNTNKSDLQKGQLPDKFDILNAVDDEIIN